MRGATGGAGRQACRRHAEILARHACTLPHPAVPWVLRVLLRGAAAVLGSGVAGADEQTVAQVIGSIADRVCDQFVNPYTFPSLHQRILEPYNYYNFGQVGRLLSSHLHQCMWTAHCP